ncbi:DUF7146 domain-containing protein [Roseovarius sp. D0-M9]|uniref:DUF7146 domain-containing protein n=1 Tax=Roseovarius sp. D0-M9 TaxID=3127117 RepID=UPI00301010C5
MMGPQQITEHLRGKWYGRYGSAPCPVCQPEQRKGQNALTLSEGDAGRLLAHCKKSGCAFGDILAAAGITSADFTNPDPYEEALRRAQRHSDVAKRATRARQLWQDALPISGSPAEAYLRKRGISCPLPNTLRWLPDIFHGPSGSYCAAMIGRVTTGGMHRTYFTKQGNRLSMSPKMMLGPCSGGAVRLSEAIGPLVVCEGIETGLSLLSGLLSGPHAVLAALSTSGMMGLKLPHRPGDLIIATDSDDSGAGKGAGDQLGHTAYALGWNVSMMAAPCGMDWNDALQSGVTA